jgi:1,4-alpha-glucan branching enzyme
MSMIMKESGRFGKVRVTFSMPAGIWADTIHLVGDFNNWDKSSTPLRLNDISWSVSLDLDPGKAYQYRYLINGADWYNDWRADRYEPNELGGDNSVVVTFLPREAVDEILADRYAQNRGNKRSNVFALPAYEYEMGAEVAQ